MNRSVPTLLGIMIVLMVVMLVIMIYDYKLAMGLATGGRLVGTLGAQLATGASSPPEVIGEAEVLEHARTAGPSGSPPTLQQARGRLTRMTQARRGAARFPMETTGERPLPARSPRQEPSRAD